MNWLGRHTWMSVEQDTDRQTGRQIDRQTDTDSQTGQRLSNVKEDIILIHNLGREGR